MAVRWWRYRFALWMELSPLAAMILPISVRSRWFSWKRLQVTRARLLRANSEVFRLVREDDGPDVLLTIRDHEKRIVDPIKSEILQIEISILTQQAYRLGVDFDGTSFFHYDATGDPEWVPNHNAIRKLRLAIYEEKFRRRQRWVSLLVPILSLVVAILALASRGCL